MEEPLPPFSDKRKNTLPSQTNNKIAQLEHLLNEKKCILRALNNELNTLKHQAQDMAKSISFMNAELAKTEALDDLSTDKSKIKETIKTASDTYHNIIKKEKKLERNALILTSKIESLINQIITTKLKSGILIKQHK